MRYFLFFCLLTAIFVLRASEALKAPEIKQTLLKEKVNILLEPEVIHIQEKKSGKLQIVVKAQCIFKKVDFKCRPGDAGFVSFWEKSRPREYVLIEGVDSADVATGSVLFHNRIGVGQRGLLVWYTGVEKIRMKYLRKGKPMWLKKYTVVPAEAEKYLRKKQEK